MSTWTSVNKFTKLETLKSYSPQERVNCRSVVLSITLMQQLHEGFCYYLEILKWILAGKMDLQYLILLKYPTVNDRQVPHHPLTHVIFLCVFLHWHHHLTHNVINSIHINKTVYRASLSAVRTFFQWDAQSANTPGTNPCENYTLQGHWILFAKHEIY